MKEFPVKVVRIPMTPGDTWLLIAEDCPLSKVISKQVPCMSGAYDSCDTMYRLGPVCQYTTEYDCTRENDGPRTHQHCWHDEGGIPGLTAGDHIKFGHVSIRHATQDEMEERRALGGIEEPEA